MGTTYQVTLASAPKPPVSEADLGQKIQSTLDRIDGLMSTYDSDSELSQFNDHADTTPFPVSADTAAVVRLALEVSELTDGAFDVTVGPLVDLWGFGSEGRRTTPPSAADIARCRAQVGYQHLSLLSPPALQKALPDLHVDLSAVAKGYAVDQVAELLTGLKVANFLVEVGGECRARGVNNKGAIWRIGIDRPVAGNAPGSDLYAVVQLTERALATSGDYRNFFEWHGRRYAHTLDPTTGRPVEHSLASASVLAPTCAQADALATACMVLGPARALALAKRLPDVEVLLLAPQTEGGLRQYRTPDMPVTEP